MSKAFPLQPLIDLAKNETDIAIRKLGELNRQNRSISGKLDLLLQYRQEYQLRFEESVRCGMNQAEWRNYQHFFYKLDEAIDQQRQLQLAFRQTVEASQIEYQEKQKKLKSFETLAQRHETFEYARGARLEQKEQDDLSNKAFMRKRNEEE
ncbi:MAG: flagellar export protein FliJ [Burkholderiales bacterium]|nr:flagellar export protein FliJ [Burkholderiales bacterium]